MDRIKQTLSPFFLSYLRACARLQIQKIKPRIIGIGGSSGKTSLSKLTAAIVGLHSSVLYKEGKNSETGIPLAILGLDMDNVSIISWLKVLFLAPWQLVTNWKRYQYFITEMGIDGPVAPKNMGYLLTIVQPTIGAVTNINLEHSVYFDPYVKATDEKERTKQIFSMIAKEENSLLMSLPLTGSAIINLDDPAIASVQPKVIAQKISLSLYDKDATLFVKHLMVDTAQFAMEIIYDKKSYVFRLDQPLPQHFAYTFLFILALAMQCNISIDQAIEDITKHFVLPPGRMSIFKGIKDTTIIDSSYNNATITPILDMLDFLVLLGKKRRKVAIIGDMRELGSMSKENHELMAKKLIHSADMVITIGPLMRNYVAPLLEKAKVQHLSFPTFTEAKQPILDSIKENDVILVKGSQNTLFLERVVELLLADKKDVVKLCRRGALWDEKRALTA